MEELEELVSTMVDTYGPEPLKSLLVHCITELGGPSAPRPGTNTARIIHAFDWLANGEGDPDVQVAEMTENTVATVQNTLNRYRRGWNSEQPVRRDLSDLDEYRKLNG